MTLGLRVWGSNGSIVLDVTDRITRFLGVYYFSIPNGRASVDISVPGASPGTWFAVSMEAFAFVMNNIIRVTRPGTYGSLSGTVLVFRA
jgi:hypothetical protein